MFLFVATEQLIQNQGKAIQAVEHNPHLTFISIVASGKIC